MQTSKPSSTPAKEHEVAYASSTETSPLLARVASELIPGSAPAILLFGDSVMLRVSNQDTDVRSLGQMIADGLPARVFIAACSALSPQLAIGILRMIERGNRPSTMAVPVNLRSFSPQWDLNPAYQFERELAAIDAWLAAPTSTFPPQPDLVECDGFNLNYEATSVNYELSRCTTIGQFRAIIKNPLAIDLEQRERLRQLFVFHYSHELQPGHRRLADFVKLGLQAAGLGIKPIFYCLPINGRRGEELAGARFSQIVAANVLTIKHRLGESGFELHDFSRMCEPAEFFKPDLTVEHLNERGRTRLAASLVALIEQARTG